MLVSALELFLDERYGYARLDENFVDNSQKETKRYARDETADDGLGFRRVQREWTERIIDGNE